MKADHLDKVILRHADRRFGFLVEIYFLEIYSGGREIQVEGGAGSIGVE